MDCPNSYFSLPLLRAVVAAQAIRYAMQNLVRGALVLGGCIFLAVYTNSAILVVVGEAALFYSDGIHNPA